MCVLLSEYYFYPSIYLLALSIILLLLLLPLCYRSKRRLRVHNAVGTCYTYIYIYIYKYTKACVSCYESYAIEKKTHKKLHKKTVCEFHWKTRVLQITANTEERPAAHPKPPPPPLTRTRTTTFHTPSPIRAYYTRLLFGIFYSVLYTYIYPPVNHEIGE